MIIPRNTFQQKYRLLKKGEEYKEGDLAQLITNPQEWETFTYGEKDEHQNAFFVLRPLENDDVVLSWKDTVIKGIK